MRAAVREGPDAHGVRCPTPAAFTTDRLDALPLRVEYAEEMAVVLDDPALHTYTGGVPGTAGELRARYRRQAAGSPDPGVRWWNWVLRERDEGGALVGYAQATVDVAAAQAEIAWVIGTRRQGRGYAKEASKALVGRLLAMDGLGAVLAHVHPEHRASQAVARAAGLARTGEWEDGEEVWRRGMVP